jgi:hypothetical protein
MVQADPHGAITGSPKIRKGEHVRDTCDYTAACLVVSMPDGDCMNAAAYSTSFNAGHAVA